MAKKFLSLIILISVISHQCLSFPLFQKKYPNHQIPSEIKPILDSHADEMVTFFREHYLQGANIFPWLPQYVIKNCIPGRLEGLEYCDRIIKKYPQRMSLLELPKKYYYKSNKNSRAEYIIAEKVEGAVEPGGLPSPTFYQRICYLLGTAKKPKQLNLQQTTQLTNFFMKSGWYDTRRDNFALRDNGNISIIDTQLQCFAASDKIARKESGIKGLKVLLRENQIGYLDDPSQQYLRQRVQYEEESLAIDQWIKEELRKEPESKKMPLYPLYNNLEVDFV